MKSEIINKLDELYSNYLVYRTIIVCDDSSQDKYVNILKDNNYDNYVLKEYDMTIDYNTLDVRIFLIEKKYFINFIKRYIEDKINANIDINMTYFYNSIIIHFENTVVYKDILFILSLFLRLVTDGKMGIIPSV